jgi:hypothetical protein
MELILLLLIAGIAGYWLAGSRFSKSVDEAASKVSETTRGAADQAGGWARGLFSRKKPSEDVVDAEFEEQSGAKDEPESEDVKPAEKAVSRRKKADEPEEEESGEK